MLAQGRALPGASEGYEPGLRQSFPGVQKLPKPPEPFRPCTTDPRPSRADTMATATLRDVTARLNAGLPAAPETTFDP